MDAFMTTQITDVYEDIMTNDLDALILWDNKQSCIVMNRKFVKKVIFDPIVKAITSHVRTLLTRPKDSGSKYPRFPRLTYSSLVDLLNHHFCFMSCRN